MEATHQLQCPDAPDPAYGPSLHTVLEKFGSFACQLLNATTKTPNTTTTGANTPDKGGGGDDPPRGRFPPLDPEQRQYIFALIKSILTARFIALCYEFLILFVIFVLAFRYKKQRRRDQLRYRAALQARRKSSTASRVIQHTEAAASGSSSSSSSSTIGVATTPPGVAVPKDTADASSLDVERVPLLSSRSHNAQQTKQKKGRPSRRRLLSSFLARQPAPIPVVNKNLPSNGTSLFIIAWLFLNIFVHLLGLTFQWNFFFVFADKAGAMFVVNLPLLYLLSAKNQPLRRWTGYSYEALNIFHRRVGEYMCFLAAVHFSGMVLWQFVIAEEWLKRLASPGLESPKEFFSHPVILYGLGAFVAYEVLYFSSLGSFRVRWYETFLAMHVVLQALGLGFLWFHFWTARPFVLLSAGIFLVDRVIWRLGLKRTVMEADVVVLEDGETVLLSADWDVPAVSQERDRWWVPSFLRRRSIIYGWKPSDHVFLTVPALGRSHALQAHPFTIASAAPGLLRPEDSTGEDNRPVHAWLSLLIRAQDGFTGDLLRYAETHSRINIRVDGPYGSSQALMDMLRAQDSVILVAGGSGIAVTSPLAWALLNDTRDNDGIEDDEEDKRTVLTGSGGTQRRRKQRVQMLWVTHSRSHRSWIPQDRLGEMEQMGLHLVMPEPTEEVGRPDVADTVEDWIQGGPYPVAVPARRAVGVVVSGPDGLNRTVRNVCADAIALNEEVDVRVAVEKFGW
ncbi:hypothetical protein QBC37DRAFT_164742 [Rhypophila decipiens]|uniref:FAD-binding FR-type domain-containing protein n=1 Tax=Rhypophila decipiens TaxID=261697 RepID=A0AAN6YGI6_9PEZI|nr:hypothetical protein QBC37DRAFT_164742 [Rhypophila decipiens]